MPTHLRTHVVNSLSRRAFVCLFALSAALPLATSITSAVADPAPLAIQGYDPVAYFTIGKPTPGLAAIEHEWAGHRYRFVSLEHRDVFKAEPARYAPQFENWCAMALSLGLLVKSDPHQWLISDGKLYLFGSPAPKGPALFQQNLAANIAKANKNRSIIPKY